MWSLLSNAHVKLSLRLVVLDHDPVPINEFGLGVIWALGCPFPSYGLYSFLINR
jgi:hypothetical protein